jgi:hypothetical protein
VGRANRSQGGVLAGAKQLEAAGELPLRFAQEAHPPIHADAQRAAPAEHRPTHAIAQRILRDGVGAVRAGEEIGADDQPRARRADVLQHRQFAQTTQGQMILMIDLPQRMGLSAGRSRVGGGGLVARHPPGHQTLLHEEAMQRAGVGQRQARQSRVARHLQQHPPRPEQGMALAVTAGGRRDAGIELRQRVRGQTDRGPQRGGAPPPIPTPPLARPRRTIPQRARRLRVGQPVFGPQPHHFQTFSYTTCRSGHDRYLRIICISRRYPRPRPFYPPAIQGDTRLCHTPGYGPMSPYSDARP